MISHTTRRFRELFDQLPAHVRRQARDAYRLFQQNPLHPGLRFKRVNPDPPINSVRVGLSYRDVGVHQNNEMLWFWIGSHADYDQLLKQL